LDLPMKRLPTGYAKALGAFPSITSTEAISDVEDELAFAPRKDKGKGKAKLREMPELPESVWTRIFELVYEDITEGELLSYTPNLLA